MNTQEKILYAILVLTNCVLVYNWVMYGFFESTLAEPSRSRSMISVTVGLVSFLVASLLHKYEILKFNFLLGENGFEVVKYVLGPPLAFMILLKLLLMKSCISKYNKAVCATNYWKIKHLSLGHILTEEGFLLRDFPRAQKALKYFDQAIESQKQGSLHSTSHVFSIYDHEADYSGLYSSHCPNCGHHLKVFPSRNGNMSNCMACNKVVTTKQIENNIHVCVPGEFRKKLTDHNRRNISVALGEKGLLLRMMNDFAKAKESFVSSLNFAEEILVNDPDNTDVLKIKSLNTFRLAELNHVQGHKEEARRLYNESIQIDEETGDTREKSLIMGLIKEL